RGQGHQAEYRRRLEDARVHGEGLSASEPGDGGLADDRRRKVPSRATWKRVPCHVTHRPLHAMMNRTDPMRSRNPRSGSARRSTSWFAIRTCAMRPMIVRTTKTLSRYKAAVGTDPLSSAASPSTAVAQATPWWDTIVAA